MPTPADPAAAPGPIAVSPLLVPAPDDFAELDADVAARWSRFGDWDTEYFPKLVGLHVEEIRMGYTRMRLPFRPELNQPAGVVHGGAIATLIDTVVVPSIGVAYDEMPMMLTLSMTINYLGALRDDDAIAEGWVTRRGRSVVFCEAMVRTASTDAVVATGTLVYSIRPFPPGATPAG